MKKVLFIVAAVAALGAYAGPASAVKIGICNFNEPGKAKGLKSSFVRAYATCGGITFQAPNTSTMAGVPGCDGPDQNTHNGPFPLSAYKFLEKGSCSIKTSHKVEKPCSTNPGVDCSNLTLDIKCSGLGNADGETPNNQSGWNLNTVARTTFADEASGDITVIDFPAQFPLGAAAAGKIKGKFNTNDLLNDLFQNGSELPACTAIELVSVAIADPSGNIFATLGTSGR